MVSRAKEEEEERGKGEKTRSRRSSWSCFVAAADVSDGSVSDVSVK